MKCNFWNEWLSSGSPAQEGSSPPHPGCPLTLVFFQLPDKKTHLFNPGSAAGPVLVQESKLCLMRLVLCQPRCWEMISKPIALCQGVMDGAGGCLLFSGTWVGGRGGMHTFWFVNQILGALVQGKKKIVCGYEIGRAHV